MRWLALIATLAAVAAQQSAAAVIGSHRTLVLLATWGPQPWTRAEVDQAAAGADAFLRKSSFGKLALEATVTPWLQGYPEPPTCPPPVHERVAPALTDGPRAAAEAAGYRVDSYDRLVYVVPQMECPWRGVGAGREVMLNGILSAWAIVHELGHTYGLAHAHGKICRAAGNCRQEEYGDPFSPMGNGLVDFSAYEKLFFGWIHNVVFTTEPGSYVIGRPDDTAAAPHALVVTAGAGQFWFEQRLDVDTPGLAVRMVEADVPDDDLEPSTLFMDDPGGRDRPTLAAGEVFRLAGAFSVRYAPSANGRATLAFAWLDRARPRQPRIVAPSRARPGQTLRIAWSSADPGSGLASCSLSVNGRRLAKTEGNGDALVGPLRRGLHTLSVVCTDRAGNRSRVTSKRIRVRR
jgi:hypothetical protein